jgi:hypothetical protein
MVVLGNIFHKGIIDPADAKFGNGIKLNPAGWNFSSGVTKPYSGRGTGNAPLTGEFEFSKQIMAFAVKGSFFFRSNNPESVRIMNWGDLQNQLIIKLTQTIYSFRQVYVVTESATASDWALAIAGADKAELEIASDIENFGLVDIFGHHATKTIQSNYIEYYHREAARKPVFFKAKKLAVQEERTETFISTLISQRFDQDGWASGFFDYGFCHDAGTLPQTATSAQASVLDMLQANELNPNTALLYFRWADATLDDVENFFISYGGC